ncbi:hypothetical protein AB0N29_10430 [Nocardioides sp. NPDC092400]|uniref:hypothetical protein n=1 Tax=Nocardioides sp. NPDC092400 TaxID=3155196 RepID=UPI0034487B02
MTTLTRGPLPAAVYWRRRLVLLSVALVLVLGIGKVLGSGSDGSDPDRAAPAAADTSPTATVTVLPSGSATPGAATDVTAGATVTEGASTPGAAGGSGKPGKPGQSASAEPVLAAPVGRCEGTDVAVTPEVEDAVAGKDVTVVLNLRTVTTPACTWRVNTGNVTLSITSGSDDIWSTRRCPKALPGEDVVVRNNVTTAVPITWKNAARMDEDCSGIAEWALPGTYHATAAALGGEPSDARFLLKAPVAPTVTRTAEPQRR